MSTLDTDEAFARQLQEQELGIRRPNTNTPLIRVDDNPTVINARMNDIASARITVGAIVLIHIPQVIAALIMLPMYWNDEYCDAVHHNRWNWWAAISAIRMLTYTIIVCLMYVTREGIERNMHQLANMRNFVDTFGLLWFVIGNMWIFGNSSTTCSKPSESPIYNLCVAMLLINYLQLCFPCVVAILLIPVFCFCMPCLIRLLARMQAANAPKGATEAAIEQMALVTVTEETFPQNAENTCPICLSEMTVGEKMRQLPCNHMFHHTCVDEWLRVNASCPTCRNSIFQSVNETTRLTAGGGTKVRHQKKRSSKHLIARSSDLSREVAQ